MREKKTIVVSARCKNCYQDSPKAFQNESQSIAKCLSEYQSAYKSRPWQPVRASLRPDQVDMSREKARSMMEKKSTYGVDYVTHLNPKKVLPKKHKAELKAPEVALDGATTYKEEYVVKEIDPPKSVPQSCNDGRVIIKNPNQEFQGDSIYTVSYQGFDKEMMASCRQSPIKKKDNIEIPGPGKSENSQSTAQSDFVYHANVERPQPMRPVENTQRPTDPLEERTEYKDFFTNKPKNVHICVKNKAAQAADDQFFGISTAMADFVTPKGFHQQMPCRPAVSNHFSTARFDGTTTFSQAYKPWPVRRYELPIWAKKPKYKRPCGGMIVNSLYMHDFTDPKMIVPPSPLVPNTGQRNPIKNHEGDCVFTSGTTYNQDYKLWEDCRPPESYRVIEVYTPPKEKMVCETNQRSHFRGTPSDKMKPCRHVSQHRQLNTNTLMTFVTTYDENFQPPRPGSGPSSKRATPNMASHPRSTSAPVCAPTTVLESHSIPKPNLTLPENGGVSNPSSTEPTVTMCEKCLKAKDMCTCDKKQN